ncbi:MAG TPA: hypothetical protein VK991_03320, partial [Halomonas sp.]|nr:hypothetical protein [Halomonas sp.]
MTTNLLVYPSTLPGEPLERYAVEGMTLDHWLRTNVDGYAPGDKQPISATVNGVVVEPAQWADTYITADTVVELRPQPQGVETLIIAAVAAAVAVAATILLKPSLPSQKNRSGARGAAIDGAVGDANRPRLGDVIPELAGRHKRFPDYLSQARRRFSGPKEQQLDMLLCVGRGEFDIEYDSISVGNTPAQDIGSSVSFQIFEPGEDVSGHRAHENWYNAPEVGSTVGGSGLKLRSTRDLEQEWTANDLALSGSTITGSDQPEGWGEGTTILVSF